MPPVPQCPPQMPLDYEEWMSRRAECLKLFIEMGSDSLDLHTLFEAGGNDPESRKRVLDVITRLVDTGHLEPQGSDFYLLTDKGRQAIS